MWRLIMVKYQQIVRNLLMNTTYYYVIHDILYQNALSFPVLTQCCSSRGLIQMQYKRCFINSVSGNYLTEILVESQHSYSSTTRHEYIQHTVSPSRLIIGVCGQISMQQE